MEITSPQTPEEFEAYFDVRWRVLRQAWNQPRGSERDPRDAPGGDVEHVMARAADGRVVGCGRGELVAPGTAQVRYMAVDENCRSGGIGGRMLDELEARLRRRGAQTVFLNAREAAVQFYLRHGYTIVGPIEPLYGVIPHFRMTKRLDGEGA